MYGISIMIKEKMLCFFPNDINNDGKAIVNEVVHNIPLGRHEL